MTALGHAVGDDRRASVALAAPGLVLIACVGLWRALDGAWISVALLGVAAAVLCVVAFTRPRALERFVRTVGHLASRVVAKIAFGLLAVPLVLVPWLVGVVARVDPLWSRPGWGALPSDRSRVAAMWRPDEQRLPAVWRARRAATAVGLVALVLLGVVMAPTARRAQDTPAAFAGSDWYPEYREDIEWVLGRSNFDPMSDVHITDVSTRHVNVVDGARTTWIPPTCEDCVTLDVWFYGGSAAFGVGQRDLHTIPSELARAAWEEGIRLEVFNRGSPGDSHWDAARRLAWDLAGGDAAPDLVVFYDGVNDVQAALLELDPVEPPSHVRPRFWELYLSEFPQPVMSRPESVSIRERTTPEPETAAEWGTSIATRYARATEMSNTVLAGVVPQARFFWQPSIEHRDVVDGEPRGPGLEWARERAAAVLEELPDEVVDLSSVFDGVTEPLYYDGVHTNELGARIVAEAMLGHLAADLDRLTASAATAGGSE